MSVDDTQDTLINNAHEIDPTDAAIYAMIEAAYEAAFGGEPPEPTEAEIDESIEAQAVAHRVSDAEYDQLHPAFYQQAH
jgi:hypothetical protein